MAFVLKGQLNPLLQGPAKVYLFQAGEITDSASVNGGKFEITAVSRLMYTM